MPKLRWLVPEAEDHNGPQWLVVKFCALLKQPSRGGSRPGRRMLLHPGWYVVRTCPCHFGERVTTLPFHSRARAEHARTAMLSVSEARQ